MQKWTKECPTQKSNNTTINNSSINSTYNNNNSLQSIILNSNSSCTTCKFKSSSFSKRYCKQDTGSKLNHTIPRTILK